MRQEREKKDTGAKKAVKCPHFGKCGGCKYLQLSYEEQLAAKRRTVRELMEKHCKVRPAIAAENPWHYRCKVQAVFGLDRKKRQISGVYEEKSHRILPVESCLIEDEKADAIIGSVRELLKSFKIKVYDEDTGYGLLRYVLVRRAAFTGEIMVVLVTASPVFPSKKNFVEALRRLHPEITTVVQNINDRTDSLVLGSRFQTLFGRGYIVDRLCGCSFKISPGSFYQVNPPQAQKLYEKAIELAGLTGRETVVDAYCGTGTIGIIAAGQAKQVLGAESNPEAVRDAVGNARANDVKNIRFYREDAGRFLQGCAADGMAVDVLLMDPPRAGSSEAFLEAAACIGPKRIVYVSCNPVTLERDVAFLEKKGYRAREVWPVDMFPWSGAVEAVCVLDRKQEKSR
ncbi:MAG: 23S rRNA (uracil(1939)-C(5))-methyltransferase RlmD [Eubacteriales bacterium]|nr:23S rRNA (uracil(1939)-C(5))-methyltransferase RlmD [Eubacteriales bacterium]